MWQEDKDQTCVEDDTKEVLMQLREHCDCVLRASLRTALRKLLRTIYGHLGACLPFTLVKV